MGRQMPEEHFSLQNSVYLQTQKSSCSEGELDGNFSPYLEQLKLVAKANTIV